MPKAKTPPAPIPGAEKDATTELVAVSALKPHPRNYRVHPPEQLAHIVELMRIGGVFKNIVVARDNTILMGHGVTEAAKLAGRERLPVRRLDVDPDDPRALMLVAGDNEIGKLAQTDDAALAAILAGVNESIGLLGTGMDDAMLAALIGNAEVPTNRIDKIPPLPKKPISKTGTIWKLGDHIVMCGDCRSDADVSTLLAGRKISVAVSSPPYAQQRDYDKASGFLPIPQDEYVQWFAMVSKLVADHMEHTGSWFINIKEHCDDGQRVLYVKDLVIAHVREWGWKLVDEFCWRNTKNGVPGGWNNRFKNAWEPIFHFSKSQKIKFLPEAVLTASDSAFNYSPDHGKTASGSGFIGAHDLKEGFARPSNVIEAAAEGGQVDHPAPYPIEVPEFFVNAFSARGDTIYDPFTGSGTTLIAAEKHGRVGRAMEISPGYVDVIVERWETFSGQKAKQIRGKTAARRA